MHFQLNVRYDMISLYSYYGMAGRLIDAGFSKSKVKGQ